jgi:hypothetical protein
MRNQPRQVHTHTQEVSQPRGNNRVGYTQTYEVISVQGETRNVVAQTHKFNLLRETTCDGHTHAISSL